MHWPPTRILRPLSRPFVARCLLVHGAELLIEGRAEEAARVLSDEMPAAGVGGDARSEALAGLAEAERSGRSPEDLSRMRTAKLAGLLRAGAEGRREARRLLNALVERGVADAHQTELFCS